MATEPEFYPEGKKCYVPLENNPEVLTPLAHSLGVTSSLVFHDIYTLSDVSHIPRPAQALICTIHGPVYRVSRRADFPTEPSEYGGSGASEPVVWVRQTIGNACGLYALLHACLNGSVAQHHVQQGSVLARLRKELIDLPPDERAQVVHESKELELAHKAVACTGQSTAPDAREKAGHHYIAFVKSEGRLWELEGCWKGGPIDRGKLDDADDVVSAKALEQGVGRFVKTAVEMGDVGFSLVALAPAVDGGLNGV